MQVADKGRVVVGIGHLEEFRENAEQSKKLSLAVQKTKAASQAGRELLNMVLREEFGIDISKENEPIGKEIGGKPFLKNHEDVFFNISHSGEYVACAVARVQVGIDIQYHKVVNVEKMAKKILSEEEWGAFEKAGRSLEEFYSFWTKKESFLKYTGEGIRRNLKELDYESGQFLILDFQEGYSGKICLPETWDGEIVLREWKG